MAFDQQVSSVPPMRGDLFAQPCPSRDVLKHLCSRWGVLIMVALRDGRVMRFSELRRQIGGVSEKMLSQTLQQLCRDGFIHRKAYEVVPPYVEYQLTPMGEEAAQLVAQLAGWIEENLPRVLAAQQQEH